SGHDDRVSAADPFVLLSCVAVISSLLVDWWRRIHGPPAFVSIRALYARGRAFRVLFCPSNGLIEQKILNRGKILAIPYRTAAQKRCQTPAFAARMPGTDCPEKGVRHHSFVGRCHAFEVMSRLSCPIGQNLAIIFRVFAKKRNFVCPRNRP